MSANRRSKESLAAVLACGVLLAFAATAPAQTHSLQVITGLGTYGIVTAEPGNYTCSSLCTWSYPAGTAISLLPTAPAGEAFLAWETCTGSFLSSAPVYSLALNGDECVQAYFYATSGPYTLTVYKGAPGLNNGSISGTGGLFCGPAAGSASQAYTSGASVTLTNSPAPGWTFGYWEYNGVNYTNSTFTLVMDRDQLVQAVFIHALQPPAVNIVSPVSNAVVSVCSKTPILVSASDPNAGGAITNIQLFINSAMVARSPTSPLSLVLTNEAALGTNTLMAVAFDNLGLTNTSAVLSLTVISPGTNRLQVLGLVPTNAFEFCLCGLTSRVYAVHVSSNLFQPWAAWEVVTNSSWGVLPVVDRSISNSPIRFYRAGLATDLAVATANLTPTNPAAGTQVAASITITNQACSGISVDAGPFHVGFYGLAASPVALSGLPPFFEQLVPGCTANASVSFNLNISIPSPLAPGTYYLGYLINDQAEVPECDLSNNGIGYWTLTVH